MNNLEQTCVFCDDVRQEVSGKLTLIGTYSGRLLLNEALPLVLPTLNAVCFLRVSEEKSNCELIMKQNGLIIQSIPLETLETDKQLVYVVQLIPFKIEKEGELEVFIKCEDALNRIGLLQIQTNS